MRLPLLALCLLTAAPLRAGTWTRVDRSTLKFEGDIDWGEYEKFSAAYDGDVKELIVTSGGGSAEDALKIAQVLAASDVKVTVEKECMSSCAAYFFVAGHRREIHHGVVGFHGNMGGCEATDPGHARAISEMRRQGASEAVIKESLEREAKAVVVESAFLQTMGVSPQLFVRACTPDKGMGDGKGYVFLLPTRATFEKYGIYGVVGGQDPAVIKALGYPVVVD